MIAITHSHRDGTNLIHEGRTIFSFNTVHESSDVLGSWFTRAKQLGLNADEWREGIDLITGQYVRDAA